MRTVLETTGQVCPFPVIEAEEAMEELSTGDAAWTITVRK